MEELIWKYLDGQCSSEEKSEVEQKLKSDAEFLATFESIKRLDDSLLKTEVPLMSKVFSEQLATAIRKEVAFKPSEALLPKKFWVVIAGLFAVAIFIAIRTPQSAGLLQLPDLDPKLINMIGWVTVSFLFLTLLDQGLMKWIQTKRNFHIMA